MQGCSGPARTKWIGHECLRHVFDDDPLLSGVTRGRSLSTAAVIAHVLQGDRLAIRGSCMSVLDAMLPSDDGRKIRNSYCRLLRGSIRRP